MDLLETHFEFGVFRSYGGGQLVARDVVVLSCALITRTLIKGMDQLPTPKASCLLSLSYRCASLCCRLEMCIAASWTWMESLSEA